MLFAPEGRGDGLFPGADKVVHLALFAALAGTARWRFGGRVLVVVLCAAYAVLSELVQAVALSGRSGDVLDVVADLAGVALGWLVARRR